MNIFETNSRKEIVRRFLTYYSKGDMEFLASQSSEYINGINTLKRIVNDRQLDKAAIEKASEYFSIAIRVDKGKNCLLSYLGQIVCFYIMDNLFAVKSLIRVVSTIEPLVPINMPTKINMKGVGQNILKGAGVGVGLLLRTIPPLSGAGATISQVAMRCQAENVILDKRPLDKKFYSLRNEIITIDYEKLHRMLR